MTESSNMSSDTTPKSSTSETPKSSTSETPGNQVVETSTPNASEAEPSDLEYHEDGSIKAGGASIIIISGPV